MSGLMDFSLMSDPIFLFIGVSNVFGMLGFYVPFVFIIDAATDKVQFVECLASSNAHDIVSPL